jgi:anthranilate synthase component 1
MLQPEFKEFSRLAREATLVPVVKTVSADLLTPVSAFLAVAADEPHSFLLESVERGEHSTTINVIEALAKAPGVEPAELLRA